jgi:RND family efflux transporter MFP subunit
MKATQAASVVDRNRIPPIACAIVLLVSVLSGCSTSTKATADDTANAPRVAVVKASRQSLTSTLEIASEFQPFQEIDVYAKESGYIQKLYVDWGTHVKQGQLLALLEIPELQQQLQGDEAAVHRSEQNLERAHEQLTQAESSYDVAHLTYTRLADVQKTRPELISQQDIDVAHGKDLEGSAAVSAARDNQAAAQQEMAAARATLAKDDALYSYARMTAPFDGVVTRINAYTGALLPAGTSSNIGESALCHLSQNDLLRLVIPVPERAVASVRMGEPISVNVSALKETFSGKVVRYSDQIDPSTRTMHTELQVPNPKYEIVPGMYADVKIPLQTESNAVTLPIQAVQPKGTDQGTVLIVNRSNHIEQRDVKLGIQTATSFEILSGVQQNDMAVFGEQAQFRPGMLVSPQLIQPSTAE